MPPSQLLLQDFGQYFCPREGTHASHITREKEGWAAGGIEPHALLHAGIKVQSHV